MLRRCLIAVAIIGLLASPAFAQRVEVSGAVGYTFSEGVDFTGVKAANGSIYDRVDPAAGFSYNFTFGGYVTEQAEIEFLWSRQSSTLEVTGNGPQLNGDMTISNYHGNFVYNFGGTDTPMRPFVFIGLGATSYGAAVFPAQSGLPGKTTQGLTKFSWGIGAGVKGWASRNVGFKGMFRFVPTYIKSEAVGWWCDPYWGCAQAVNMSYSNAFEISGGVVARF